MRLEAHGLRIELPAGWSGCIFARPGGLAALHAGDFQVAIGGRSTFGDDSLARMPAAGSFVALVEYRLGNGLTPGVGLFGRRGLPLPLHPRAFASNHMARPRPGQVGMQHFFTQAGRPFCLYVVLSGPVSARRGQLARLDRVLGSLRVEHAGGGSAQTAADRL